MYKLKKNHLMTEKFVFKIHLIIHLSFQFRQNLICRNSRHYNYFLSTSRSLQKEKV